MARHTFLALSLFLSASWLVGCGPANNKAAKPAGGKTEHEHEHAHPAEGPHGGHLVVLAEPGKENKEEYHVEWDHNEDGKITVWILDGKAKETVSIAAESIRILVSIGPSKETHEFELPALDRTTGEKPTAFKFEIVSKELLGALETPKQTSPMINVDVNGTPYVGKIEEHEEHAGHKH